MRRLSPACASKSASFFFARSRNTEYFLFSAEMMASFSSRNVFILDLVLFVVVFSAAKDDGPRNSSLFQNDVLICPFAQRTPTHQVPAILSIRQHQQNVVAALDGPVTGPVDASDAQTNNNLITNLSASDGVG